MFGNYLKIAWRNLWKNKINAGINLAGLALGLACTIVILLWIKRELSVDQFHAGIDHLYLVRENQTYSSRDIFTVRSTPGPLVPAMRDAYPEIEFATRLTWGDQHLFSRGAEALRESGYYADPDFFQMFSFPLLQGDPATAIARPHTVAVSRRLAEKHFGTADVLGETILVDDTARYEISGVFENIPDNSTLEFDFIMPLEEYLQRNDFLQNWNNNSIQAYLRLRPGVDGAAFSEKIKDVVRERSEQQNVDVFLQPFADVYLRTDYQSGTYQGGGRIVYVRLFTLIAAFILLIACINFMNLTTAYSTRRAKEVGIRRVGGATRSMLITQFLTECLLLTLLAGGLALGIVRLALPWFNHLFDVDLRLALLDGAILAGLAGLLLVTGLLAGSYPAFFLSRFEPVRVLKGVVRTGAGAVWFRKGMVVAQFAIATFLILSTLVVSRQMQYLRHKNLGYDRENLITITMMGQMWDKYDVIKSELLRTPGVASVSASNGYIFSWGNNSSGFTWPGKDPEDNILFQTIPVDYDFLATIGAGLAAGRDFSREHPADSANFVINQRAAELMGLENPVGQPLGWGDGESSGTIIGVARDFNVTALYNEQDPVILMLRPWKNFIYARLRPGDFSESLAQIETVVKRHNPVYPFEYSFVDQEYDKLYRSEQRTSALSQVFAFLSIFVSCLGLFGLALFATQQRTKEIGVRKVLGASVAQLSSLLSKEFLVLVLAGFLLGAPAAWYLTSQWLQDFAYRTELTWWLFAVAGGLALFIAYLTVSVHTVRAASGNPVRALRYE